MNSRDRWSGHRIHDRWNQSVWNNRHAVLSAGYCCFSRTLRAFAYKTGMDDSAVAEASNCFTIETYAGVGSAGYSGDVGPATCAYLNNPLGRFGRQRGSALHHGQRQ